MRRIARTQLRYCGYADGDDDVIYMVGLVVTELVTNAVEHGKGDKVRFALTCCESGALRVEVDDYSAGAPQVGRPDQDAERGRGLVLVEALTDAWGRDGTCTWCTFAPAPEESDETA
jgi:two-component sensor histidine kinase